MKRRRAVVAGICVLGLAAAGVALYDGDARPSGDAVGPASPAATEQPPGGRRDFRKSAWFRAACELPPAYLERIDRGIYDGRTPDIAMVPREPNFFGNFTATSHSGPWGYLQRVPLVFYGPGFVRDQGTIEIDRDVTVADIAPTIAELIGTDFPEDRPGRPVTEALLPEGERTGTPRLVLTVVWDGGGWNVLDRWPGAWPHLERMMEAGTTVTNATVGSSPSVTPAIHATIGTGAYPSQHGIVDIPLRIDSEIVESYPHNSPRYLEIPALGDLYDAATGNRALVGMYGERNWHLGMIGHGAYSDGGDKDDAVLQDDAHELTTHPDYYSLPSYLHDVPGLEEDIRAVDLADGALDGTWMGHDRLSDPEKAHMSPVPSLYQVRLIKALFDNEGYGDDDVADLFYTNFKQIDQLGHAYNMINPEIRSALEFSDIALEDLTTYLDSEVGRESWVLILTADHGQAPDAESTGAWPIDVKEFQADLAASFDSDPKELIAAQRPTGVWMDEQEMGRAGIDLQDVADAITGYRVGDNVAAGIEVPSGYDDRQKNKVFSAAFPAEHIDAVATCAQGPS